VSVWFHFGPLSGAGLVTVLNDCDFVGSKVQFEFSNPRMRGFPRICAMDSHGEEIGLRRDLTSEIFVSPSNDSVVIGSPAAGAKWSYTRWFESTAIGQTPGERHHS
jgi:hypothetical protein